MLSQLEAMLPLCCIETRVIFVWRCFKAQNSGCKQISDKQAYVHTIHIKYKHVADIRYLPLSFHRIELMYGLSKLFPITDVFYSSRVYRLWTRLVCSQGSIFSRTVLPWVSGHAIASGNAFSADDFSMSNPRQLMYDIFIYIWLNFLVDNIGGKYTIHWVSGNRRLFSSSSLPKSPKTSYFLVTQIQRTDSFLKSFLRSDPFLEQTFGIWKMGPAWNLPAKIKQ